MIYISTTGNDTTGDGSLGNPYLTITRALLDSGDIFLLTGTYAVSSTINIIRPVIITSNTGVNTDVTITGSCTIFNIQSNVSITYMTLTTSVSDPLITIDRMSDGSAIPTFFTTTINNCIIKYIQYALYLNGTFAVTNNTFSRQSGTSVAELLTVYSSTGTSSITTNTVDDSGPLKYFIRMTSTGSSTYVDRCNSKGGILTVTSNNVVSINDSQELNFWYQDYFTLYQGPFDLDYNYNTKLTVTMTSNTFMTQALSKFVNLMISQDVNMFKLFTIASNTLSGTDHGTLHLNKVENNSIITIDTNINIFKVYSNTIDSLPINNSPNIDSFRLRFNSASFINEGSAYDSFINTGSVYDTTVKKFGTGSIKFNGANKLRHTSFAITGDFTFQCWIRIHTVAVEHGIFEFGVYSDGIVFNLGTSSGGAYINGVSCPDLSSYVPFQTWTHIAVSRAGTLVTFYVNGISRGNRTISGTINTQYSTYAMGLGSNHYGTIRNSYINMDDFRLCLKALNCRYVPILEYPVYKNVEFLLYGGGGGGGGGPTTLNSGGGGGGGGGGRVGTTVNCDIVGKLWTINVGPAGLGAIAGDTGGGATNGGDSVIISQGTELFRAFGGGAGGSARPGLYNGAAGGCGGGACGKSGVIALGGASLGGQGYKGADSVLAGFPGGGGGSSSTDGSRYGGSPYSNNASLILVSMGYLSGGFRHLCGGGGGNNGQQYNYLLDPVHPTSGDVPGGLSGGTGTSSIGGNAYQYAGGGGGGGVTTGGNGASGGALLYVPVIQNVISYTGATLVSGGTLKPGNYYKFESSGTITFE